jgi:hypothetical protein
MVFSSTHLLLFPILLFKKAPSKIQMQTSAPCGIPKSAVWNVSNPSPLMTRVENCRHDPHNPLRPGQPFFFRISSSGIAGQGLTLLIPPLGMLPTSPREKNIH